MTDWSHVLPVIQIEAPNPNFDEPFLSTFNLFEAGDGFVGVL